jgi:hypothetical protein
MPVESLAEMDAGYTAEDRIGTVVVRTVNGVFAFNLYEGDVDEWPRFRRENPLPALWGELRGPWVGAWGATTTATLESMMRNGGGTEVSFNADHVVSLELLDKPVD